MNTYGLVFDWLKFHAGKSQPASSSRTLKITAAIKVPSELR